MQPTPEQQLAEIGMVTRQQGELINDLIERIELAEARLAQIEGEPDDG